MPCRSDAGEGLYRPCDTYNLYWGCWHSTGLRISEALSLECSDAGDDGLLIRKSKHGKSRLVPLH